MKNTKRHEGAEGCERRSDVEANRDAEEDDRQIRRWRIRKVDIDIFGPAPGCMGCRNAKAGLPGRCHSERCRKRMEEILKEPGEGRQRMQRSEARIDRRLAEHLERQEEARKTQEAIRKTEGGSD